jgi:hypothetical protein
MTTTEMTMEVHARQIARDAHANSFSSRRGSGEWTDAGQVTGFVTAGLRGSRFRRDRRGPVPFALAATWHGSLSALL